MLVVVDERFVVRVGRGFRCGLAQVVEGNTFLGGLDRFLRVARVAVLGVVKAECARCLDAYPRSVKTVVVEEEEERLLVSKQTDFPS